MIRPGHDISAVTLMFQFDLNETYVYSLMFLYSWIMMKELQEHPWRMLQRDFFTVHNESKLFK